MSPQTRNPTLTASESGSGKRKKKARTEDILRTEKEPTPASGSGRKKKKARTEKELTPPPVEEQNPSPPAVQEMDSDYPLPPQITEDNEEDTEPLQPELFFPHTEYCKTIKIASKCKVKSTPKTLEIFDRDEKLWFSNHSQFKHIWHMPSQKNHKLMGMWLTLLRTVRIEKDVKTCWFVVNGVPIKYSLREHGLISGLSCRRYPRNHESLGNLRFVTRWCGRIEDIFVDDVAEALQGMRGYLSEYVAIFRIFSDFYVVGFLYFGISFSLVCISNYF